MSGSKKRKQTPAIDNENISDDDEVTSKSKKKPRSKSKTHDIVNNNNCERRAGTITRMVLKNFMCHSFLEVNFTSNISMVIGKNGSGKSAILTALIVGLGGKAALTNRGSSIKGFVKAGKQSGSIEIELCNEGPMAYKSSVYGDRIIITRTVSATGSGTYRIRTEKGEVISTHAKEVNNITASLNIQVDNPICILNQDTSRNFLSSNDPKHKWTLFMRATRLETLEAEHKKIAYNRRETIKLMEEKEQNLKLLQNEIKRLKNLVEGHKTIITLKDKKCNLQRELVWAKVRDAEEELEGERENLNVIKKKLDNFKENKKNRREKINVLKENFNDLRRQTDDLKEQIKVQMRPELDIKRQLEELMFQYTSKKREKQQIQTTIQAKNNDISLLKNNIESVNENMTQIEQQKLKRIKDLEYLQSKLKNMDDHLETSKNDLFQIKSDLSRRESDKQQLRREVAQIEREIDNDKDKLAAVQKETGNNLLVYGRDVPRVNEMIKQNERKFQQLPKGPIGTYIKIKDKKWSSAIEGQLGRETLTSYVVDNNQDNKLLREIFERAWTGERKPQIITSKFIFTKHNVAQHLVQSPNDCVSLYEALDIDDPVVSNAVVDNSSPENILLIPSDQRAQELLSSERYLPENCSLGVTHKGDMYYPVPNYRTYAGSQNNRARLLQVDTKEFMRQLKMNVKNATERKEMVNNQLEAFVSDMEEQERKKNELEEKIHRVNRAKMDVRMKLEDLTSAAEPEVQNIKYLEQELQEVEDSLNEKNGSLGKISADLKEIKVNILKSEESINKLKNSTKELENRLDTLQEEICENQNKQKEISSNEDFDVRRIEEFDGRLRNMKSSITLKEKVLGKYESEAASVGERPRELRQVPEIVAEVEEIRHRIINMESATEDISDVVKKYTELMEKYSKSAEYLRILQIDLKELSLAVKHRNRHYKLTESYFITYIKHSFRKILEYRQFKGTIEINMEAKKLELVVIPQHGSQGLTTTSNLSGGERSFSTVAFLYSLWQCMEFPFYFLDEFDVYMDKLNRTKVIDILLHHAKSKPQLQFVFLTPQDVSFIDTDVSILRLQDPERRQVQN